MATLNTAQFSTLTAVAKDKKGNVVTLPSPVQFVSSDSSVLTVVQDPNNQSLATASGVAVGTATVTVTAGSLTATVDFTVVEAAAQTLEIQVSDPQDQA